jgi:hypothetical protein
LHNDLCDKQELMIIRPSLVDFVTALVKGVCAGGSERVHCAPGVGWTRVDGDHGWAVPTGTRTSEVASRQVEH